MGTLAVGRLVAWFAFVAAFAALAYGERFSGATEDSSKIAYEYSSSIAAVIGYALTLGIMLWIARGTRLRAAFALRRPRSWRQVVRISAGDHAGAARVSDEAGSRSARSNRPPRVFRHRRGQRIE